MDLYPRWSIKILLFGSIFVIMILTGCTAPSTPTAIPTARIINIYYSPALDYLRTDISACISSLGTLAPYLHEEPAAFSTLQPGDIVLRLGEAEWDDIDYFVTQIESQYILFITNIANTTESMEIEALKGIFSGAQSTWSEGPFADENITVWTYPEGSDLFDWLKDTFIGSSSLISTSKLAPNPGSVLKAVSDEATAIGYLPEAWMGSADQQIINHINVLDVINQSGQMMRLPVLAYLTEKPVGEVRDLLLCLQNQ